MCYIRKEFASVESFTFFFLTLILITYFNSFNITVRSESGIRLFQFANKEKFSMIYIADLCNVYNYEERWLGCRLRERDNHKVGQYFSA